MSNKAFETPVEIRYRDTDSMGHVSSPVYYDYMQSAYLEYMHDLLELPKSEKLPHIMVKTSCDYISQALYGDNLVVCSRVISFGGKSFEMEHVMHIDDDDRRVVANAKSVHVMFDYDKQATYPVPDAFKESVAAFQETA
ncbi:acyl-CoA thioesterase (plasmid) [Phaeobacter inhibens]|uniref:acyl-CoA thioesterase n=1 Tax=Phaeobacter inhibens TaxID=221822 RepID=UPI0001633291|nr:acyl-CoA thioesterase [Phaeobacter inhibens]AFO93377.1 thioesterase superfamily protein TdaD [Phaeobacter inhibens DSM 17395]AUQ48080.1 thioesterase superfamily protein TdaD [Phaeobacter inhibens]AUR05753.1 thioesterase superfamily protein TdaD [Phaeobacter inhibens]AXT24875.1 acyl-CoA thioesterase [Phaeobacter inhibens]UWR62644.1 acyl-CoA thioesterase [Phaeobacter inhibens]